MVMLERRSSERGVLMKKEKESDRQGGEWPMREEVTIAREETLGL